MLQQVWLVLFVVLTVVAITRTVWCWWAEGSPQGKNEVASCVLMHFVALGLTTATTLLWIEVFDGG